MKHVVQIFFLLFTLFANHVNSTSVLNEIAQNPFYTSDGWVEINKNGDVFSQNDFHLYNNGNKGAKGSGYTKGKAPEGVEFLRLGDDGINAGKGDGLLDFFFNSKLGKWTRKEIQNKKWVDFIDESGMPSTSEINQLEALGGKLQKKMIGLEMSPNNNTPFPGIDAVIDGGNPLSLKTAVPGKEGVRLREMVNKANELNNGNIAGHSE